MIDLDLLDAPGEPRRLLYAEFFFLLYKNKIVFHEFKKLSEWAGVFTYISPKLRYVEEELIDWLYKNNKYNLFSLAILSTHIAAHLDPVDQMLFLELLKSRQAQTMEKHPADRDILVTDPALFSFDAFED